MMKCCITSTETVGLLGMGAQDGHLDFHTAPELWPVGVIIPELDAAKAFSADQDSLIYVAVCFWH